MYSYNWSRLRYYRAQVQVDIIIPNVLKNILIHNFQICFPSKIAGQCSSSLPQDWRRQDGEGKGHICCCSADSRWSRCRVHH